MGYGLSTRQGNRVMASAQHRGDAPAPTQGKKTPSVLILKVQPVGTGAFSGFFSVQIGPITVHKCKLFRPQGKAAFITPPQDSWEEEGQRKYTTLLELPKDWHPLILSAALSAFEAQEGAAS